jgi:YVTN family beta-propeller protein
MEVLMSNGNSRKKMPLRFFLGLLSVQILVACGGRGAGQSSINQPVSSGSSPNAVPTIQLLYPSCAPAGEQFVDSVDNQLSVVSNDVSGKNFVAGSVVRWNGSDRPTTSNGSVNGLTAQISASDIAAAGTASVTVFNPGPGGGSSNSLTFTITTGAVNPRSIAVDPAGKFAYVVNSGCDGGAGGYVSMYTINTTTGALASIGPPMSTFSDGSYAGSVAIDPSGRFAYVANLGFVYEWDAGVGSVAMYTIDATTGALTSASTIEGNCPGLCFPKSVVVDPSGKFAFVTNGGAIFPYNVEMYTIDATTGALTLIGTITAGTAPVSVAVDPSGRFAYVVNANDGSTGNVSMYKIDATMGTLASIGTIDAGTKPVFIAVDPAGKFAYVTNSGSNDVSMYTINATTGALASIGTIAAGTDPVSVAVDSAGKFAYVANSGSNDLSAYSIDSATGSLTLIGMIAAGLSPTSITVHPSGKSAYVTNSGSNSVSMYSIDGATGTLTLIGTIST